MDRLKHYGRLISTLATWPVLIIWWGKCLLVFAENMSVRLGHLSPAGMHIVDGPCGSPQCDFSAFWPAAGLAWAGQGALAYQPAALQALRVSLFGPGIDAPSWLYPPVSLLLMMPFAKLPFEPAFWVWTLAALGFAVAALRLAGLGWLVILAGLASPAALWNLQLGQFGIISGAALVAGLLLLETRPFVAGALLGLLAVKPQPGLLAPVALLAARRWRALAASALAGAVLCVASLAILGAPVWVAYFSSGLRAAGQTLDAPLALAASYQQFGVSVFWMLRSFGFGLGLSHALQLLAALAAVMACWRVWRAGISLQNRAAIVVFLSLFVTPYGFTDDMVAFSFALAWGAQARGWKLDLGDALLWLWPALCPVMFTLTGWELTPLAVACAAARCWWRRG